MLKSVAVLAMATITLAASASAATKPTPRQVLQAPKAIRSMQAATDEARPGYLDFVCQGANEGWRGCFDLSDGGVFAYCLGDFGYTEAVTYLGESGGYYFFQEAAFPDWYWAFSVEPNEAGEYAVYGTLGSPDSFTYFGAAHRCATN